MIPVSIIILTKNEEKKIIDCLKNLKDFNEIIIIDDNSIDSTIEKIKSFDRTIKVIVKSLDGSFSGQRNHGLSMAKNEWVLFVDADEIISQNLKKEIKETISSTNADGLFIKRKDKFIGRETGYGDLGNVWLLRLAKKNRAEWIGDVHEIMKVSGRTSNLKNPIIHSSHENLSEFIGKLNQYSSLRAAELNRHNAPSSFLLITFMPLGKFFYLYVLKLGFLDGIYGFIHAIFMSMYTFLVQSKLYQLKRNDK